MNIKEVARPIGSHKPLNTIDLSHQRTQFIKQQLQNVFSLTATAAARLQPNSKNSRTSSV
jgi:hypothetical protein